jgi:hypothetical protein
MIMARTPTTEMNGQLKNKKTIKNKDFSLFIFSIV